MQLVKVSYEQCRLEFFEEQLAAAQRTLDYAVKRNYPYDVCVSRGEVVSFYEWAVQLAENVLQAKDDREKLIKLLCEAESAATDAALFDFGTFREQLEVEADYLLDHGVRLKTKQATSDKTSDESKRWIPVTERLPEEMKNVLAYTDVGSFAETAHWTGYRWEKTWDFEVLYGVTHWMPLPEAPKEVE